jgi:hypothetical protein
VVLQADTQQLVVLVTRYRIAGSSSTSCCYIWTTATAITMCNIIQFLFSCQHSARLPRSRCKGTKHKVTRTSVRAACTAECFLTIRLQTECSSCQHKTWQEGWKLKLERARTFLAKLTEKRMPGIEAVATLVKAGLSCKNCM